MNKDFPIPSSMAHLPLDKRGYPIPAIVLIDIDGRPHFTVNDENKRQKVIRQDCCSICGKPLYDLRFLVGGAMSAFSATGAYIDPPMHLSCVTYALNVCPYLAMPAYNKRIDDKTVDPAKVPGILAMVDNTMIDTRPDPFVMIGFRRKAQRFVIEESGVVKYVRVEKIEKVEYWTHGRRLSDVEADTRMQAYVAKLEAEGKVRR